MSIINSREEALNITNRLLATTEIAARLKKTQQAIDKRAKHENWSCQITPGRGRGGKRRLYYLDSLPLDVQAKIVLAQQSDDQAKPDLDLNQAGRSINAWGSASEANRQQALAWWEIIRAYDESTCGGKIIEGQDRFVLQYKSQNIFLGHRTFVWVTPICCGHILITWKAPSFLLGYRSSPPQWK
jgi:hypothetical protein